MLHTMTQKQTLGLSALKSSTSDLTENGFATFRRRVHDPGQDIRGLKERAQCSRDGYIASYFGMTGGHRHSVRHLVWQGSPSITRGASSRSGHVRFGKSFIAGMGDS